MTVRTPAMPTRPELAQERVRSFGRSGHSRREKRRLRRCAGVFCRRLRGPHTMRPRSARKGEARSQASLTDRCRGGGRTFAAAHYVSTVSVLIPGFTSTSEPCATAAVISSSNPGKHRQIGKRGTLRQNGIHRVEHQRERDHASLMSFRGASRPTPRRPWQYPGSGLFRRRTGRPVYAWGAKISRRSGQGRNVRKSRREATSAGPRTVCPIDWRARKILATHRSCQSAGDCRIHAFLHRGQYRLIAVATQYIHQLDAVGRKPLPAVGFRDFARVGLIEAHSRQYGPAGILDVPGVAQPVGVRLDLRARDREQRHDKSSALAKVRERRAVHKG